MFILVANIASKNQVRYQHNSRLIGLDCLLICVIFLRIDLKFLETNFLWIYRFEQTLIRYYILFSDTIFTYDI